MKSEFEQTMIWEMDKLRNKIATLESELKELKETMLPLMVELKKHITNGSTKK